MQTSLPGFSLPPLPDVFSDNISFNGDMYPYLVTWSHEEKQPVSQLSDEGKLIITAPVTMGVSAIRQYVNRNSKKLIRLILSGRPEKRSISSSGILQTHGLSIPYTVNYCERRRINTVCYHQDGSLEVQVSGDAISEDILETLEKHSEWIYIQILRYHPQYRRTDTESSFVLGTNRIPYRIKYSSRARRMTLKVSLINPVTVIAPIVSDPGDIRRFIDQNMGWIAQKLGITDLVPEGDGPNRFIDCDGKKIPYQIRTSHRAKRIILKITAEKNIDVIAPAGSNPELIHRFVQEKSDWIVEKVSCSKRANAPVREYLDGDNLPLLGIDHRLLVITGTDHPSAELKNGVIIVGIPSALIPSLTKEAVKQGYEKILRYKIHEISAPLIYFWSEQLGISPPVVRYGNQKTRWGVCSPKGIILNIRLAMAPVEVIEYVVVHELCHIKHPNHSKKFWGLVEMMLPDYKDRKAVLKGNGLLYVM